MLKRVNGRLMLSDGAYASLKRFVQVWIPAFSALYFTLGAIWGLPAVEQVVGTLAAVTTFFGVSLGVSSKQYENSGAALIALDKAQQENADGEFTIKEDEQTGRRLFSLELNEPLEDFEARRGSISFKLKQPEPK